MSDIVAAWLKSIGYHGESRDSRAGIYPEDVVRLNAALLEDAAKLAALCYANGKEDGWAARKAIEHARNYGMGEAKQKMFLQGPPSDLAVTASEAGIMTAARERTVAGIKGELRNLNFAMNAMTAGARGTQLMSILQSRFDYMTAELEKFNK